MKQRFSLWQYNTDTTAHPLYTEGCIYLFTPRLGHCFERYILSHRLLTLEMKCVYGVVIATITNSDEIQEISSGNACDTCSVTEKYIRSRLDLMPSGSNKLVQLPAVHFCGFILNSNHQYVCSNPVPNIAL